LKGRKKDIELKNIVDTATVIHEGECQTVRLPKGFRFSTATVSVRHDGEAIVLEPLKPKAWPEGFFDSICIADPSFVRPEQGQLPPVKSL
jgi:virulence-associated protein VagC